MNSVVSRCAAFLDRDGVINVDNGYIGKAEEFELMPGAIDMLAELRFLGYSLVVVTNQSGIGRGLFSEDDYSRVNGRMNRLLAKRGIALDGVYHCPHAPDDGCDCRKPKPGLILKASQDLDIDISRSILIGDKQSDIDAGRSAGIVDCYLMSDYAKHDQPPLGGFFISKPLPTLWRHKT